MTIVIKEIKVVTHIEKKGKIETELSSDWIKKIKLLIRDENKRQVRSDNQNRER